MDRDLVEGHHTERTPHVGLVEGRMVPLARLERDVACDVLDREAVQPPIDVPGILCEVQVRAPLPLQLLEPLLLSLAEACGGRRTQKGQNGRG